MLCDTYNIIASSLHNIMQLQGHGGTCHVSHYYDYTDFTKKLDIVCIYTVV